MASEGAKEGESPFILTTSALLIRVISSFQVEGISIAQTKEFVKRQYMLHPNLHAEFWLYHPQALSI